MSERTTADTLAARWESWMMLRPPMGGFVLIARDAINYARGLEGAASAAEASRDRALDERDQARRLREATARRLWGKVDKARRERDQARAVVRDAADNLDAIADDVRHAETSDARYRARDFVLVEAKRLRRALGDG